MNKKIHWSLRSQKGFTLLELIVVMAIIAALSTTVIVAINPAQRFIQARDARRTTDVESILTAVHEYIVDNKGTYPPGITTSDQQLGTSTGNPSCAVSTGGCSVTNTACLDLSSTLAKYLKSIPVDPLNGTAQKTNYAVSIDTNGIVTVKACGTGTGTTEGSTNISISQ